MHVGIAADHGGFELKARLIAELTADGHIVEDFGAKQMVPDDDYPDFVAPMATAVASGVVERGIAVCGSGVGAAIAANKIPNARAALITDCFSAHQGVEDDDMNVICLGGRVIGYNLAVDLIKAFLAARYVGAERFERRLSKIAALEESAR
jgi:ribose 5-phosphate isomerase B